MALARLQRGGLESAKCCFFVGFIMFSRVPCISRFRLCFLRVLRIVRLNDDSRDLSASHSHMFSRMKMQSMRGTTWLHTPAKRAQYFRCFQFPHVSSRTSACSEAQRWFPRPFDFIFHTFHRGKVQKAKSVSAADDCKTRELGEARGGCASPLGYRICIFN